MLVEMIVERKKFFTAQRATEQRSKPPTTQIRNRMCSYLKNMGGYKHNQRKGKSYEEIQKLFDKAYKQVNSFVPMDSEVVKSNEKRTEGSSKRAGDELESDKSKKQKIDEHVEAEKDDDQEEEEMKKHIEIVKDDEVAIDAIPLATKPPMIVEYKIDKDGRMGYFKLIRVDGSSKRLEEDYERVLWGDLKVMFEPNIKGEVWRNLQGYKVTIWKLFDTCGDVISKFCSPSQWKELSKETSSKILPDKLRWLAETLKKGSSFRPDSETNEPHLRTYQLWKKTFYEETYKLDDMTELRMIQPKKTYEEDLENEIVMIKMPSCMSFLGCTNAYDEPIEVEEALGTPMEVEPLDQPKLKDVGLTNHNIFLSSKEIPSVDEPKPQVLPNFPPLEVSLGEKRGPKPTIKPHSPDSFRMKVVDNLTIHRPPSLHVASFHPKDMYCYYHPCIDDLKKHYGFKPGLLRHSRSLGVDFLNLEVTEDDWELKSKEVSFLGKGLNLPVRPKEVEKVKIKETHQLEHII
ncbi:hypothetical protein Tco_0173182 [Tanacetum coccineum]